MFSSQNSQVSQDAVFIEDVMSTFLYTGNGSTQTITNGIDLAGKGGLVWIKSRSAATNNFLFDTNRGTLLEINSNTTDAQVSLANSVTAYNAAGFSLGSAAGINVNAATYASWTFRQQPKFFDVITWTGNGASDRVISHNLGVTPGFVISKPVSVAGGNWSCQAVNALGWNSNIALNLSDANVPNGTDYLFSTGTATTLTTASTPNYINSSGVTYVAYLFAHNAGGFGLTGTDNVISCGSYNSTSEVNLGYEPQWILRKRSASTGDWELYDTMRGWSNTNYAQLNPNLSDGESNTVNTDFYPTATGFRHSGNSSNFAYIYIAIRRGPMKVPTTGTSVFSPYAVTAATGASATTNFPIDMVYGLVRPGGDHGIMDRLRGISNTSAASPYLRTENTSAESSQNFIYNADNQTGYKFGSYVSGASMIMYSYRRAPGFFDEVCYTGTGANADISHNLAAVPELIIVKRRNSTSTWTVYSQPTGNAKYLFLNTTAAAGDDGGIWRSTTPTASVFYLDGTTATNASGGTYVAYLFATCPGVSKVGSYTGNGTTQAIDCGFTGGARFVLIKRTDSTGNWMVVDTARGLVSAGDPTLYLNSTAAEVTGVDWLDPDSSGFIVNQEGTMNANVSSASYIFLAIS